MNEIQELISKIEDTYLFESQFLSDVVVFLDACPERADELEGLLLTWVSRCKQR